MFQKARNQGDLVDILVKNKFITSKAVEQAFRKVDRALFIPEDTEKTYLNEPVRITGAGATLSTPTHHATVLQNIYDAYIAEPKSKSTIKVLDLGCGSGFLCAAFSAIYPESAIIGVEADLEALSIANKCLHSFEEKAKMNLINILPAFKEHSVWNEDIGSNFDILNVGFSVDEKYITANLIPLLKSSSAVCVAPILKKNQKDQTLTVFTMKEGSERLDEMIQVRERVSIEEKVEAVQRRLDEWTKSFKLRNGRKPSREDMFSDATAKSLFTEFTSLRKKLW
eukprot:maker-scaffold_11-snap-gene-2.31-mRNA-1 protein AED:0.28 eAED:0.74 QI:0/0.5/0.66/1/1/1/3/141/281